MILYYQNSKKQKIDLTQKPYRMLSATNLFDSDWEDVPVGTTRREISGFLKSSKKAEITIRVSGNNENDMRSNLEELIRAIDYDTATGQNGRLYVGNYYLECFVKSTKKEKVFKKSVTNLSLSIIAQEDFWKSTQSLTYEGIGLLHDKEIASSAIPSTSGQESFMIFNSNEDGTAEVDCATGAYAAGNYFMLDFGSAISIDSVSNLIVLSSGSGVPTGDLELSVSSDGENWETIATASSMSSGNSYNFSVEINRQISFIKIQNTTAGYWLVDTPNLSITLSDEERQSRILLNYGYSLNGLVIDYDEEELFPSLYVTVHENPAVLEFDAENVTVDFIEIETTECEGEVQGLVNGAWQKITEFNQDFFGEFSCDKVRMVFEKGGYIEPTITGLTKPQLLNSNYIPSDAIITISRPVNEPTIIIGSNQYGADVELNQGQRLEINTEQKTIRLYNEDGTFENVYSANNGGFEKIQEGTSLIDWNGNQKIEIQLIQKRSDPKWD